jgi:hypothetical protein
MRLTRRGSIRHGKHHCQINFEHLIGGDGYRLTNVGAKSHQGQIETIVSIRNSSEGEIPLLIRQSLFALTGLRIDKLDRGGRHGNSPGTAHVAGD